MSAPLSAKEKRRVRRALIRRQGLICFYCNQELVEPLAGTGTSNLDPHKAKDVLYATIDHLRPIARGGTNEIKNLVMACAPCHKKRHSG